MMVGGCKKSLDYALYNHILISKINDAKQVNWQIVNLGLANVSEERINDQLDKMLLGLNRLFKYKNIKQVSLGYFRMLDIVKAGSMYHPTIHLLLPMMKSYVQGRYYIKKKDWLDMWARALNQAPEDELAVSIIALNEKGDRTHQVHMMEEALAACAAFTSEECPEPASEPIPSRRWIAYSRLMKEQANQVAPLLHYDVEQFAIHDAIANHAFSMMRHWHAGLRMA